MDQAYNVAIENREVVVRFSREVFDNEALTRFLDYLELEAIRKRSELTAAEAEILADEIDQAGWARLKSTFVQP